MAADRRLIRTIRESLAARADPNKAPAMQRYMRSQMPFLGVQARGQSEVAREVFPQHPLQDAETWRDTTLALWREATYREERYLAIALTGERPYRSFQTPHALPLYEEMIVTGAWWDLVDSIAIHRLGPLLAGYPDVLRPRLLEWSRADHLWKRRASIICQNALKDRADLTLLFACIEPSLGSKEFFLRKAIGWALRVHARFHPAPVRRYLDERGAELSPLSRREAERGLGPSR